MNEMNMWSLAKVFQGFFLIHYHHMYLIWVVLLTAEALILTLHAINILVSVEIEATIVFQF